VRGKRLPRVDVSHAQGSQELEGLLDRIDLVGETALRCSPLPAQLAIGAEGKRPAAEIDRPLQVGRSHRSPLKPHPASGGRAGPHESPNLSFRPLLLCRTSRSTEGGEVKRIQVALAGVIVAGLFAAAMVAPASADARGLLTPTTKHVNCGAQPVTEGQKFCEEVSFANFTSSNVTINFIEVVDRNAAISQEFFTQPVGSDPCFEGLTLPPLDNCSLFVFFDPSQAGHRSARLNAFDTTTNEAARIGLGGRGTE
jgi:hypothetical protein